MATDVGVGETYILLVANREILQLSEILPREICLQHLNELKNEYDYMFLEARH